MRRGRLSAMDSQLRLSSKLREGVEAIHREVEVSPVLRRWVKADFPRSAYGCLLADWLEVYRALEGSLADTFEGAEVSRRALKMFQRGPSIERDLAFWQGSNVPAVSSTALAYAAHLKGLRREEPFCLLAHWYVRIGGDLGGGAVVARSLERAFGAHPGADHGLAWYHFPHWRDRRLAMAQFRETLDGFLVEPAILTELVREACAAFRWSQRVIEASLDESGST